MPQIALVIGAPRTGSKPANVCTMRYEKAVPVGPACILKSTKISPRVRTTQLTEVCFTFTNAYEYTGTVLFGVAFLNFPTQGPCTPSSSTFRSLSCTCVAAWTKTTLSSRHTRSACTRRLVVSMSAVSRSTMAPLPSLPSLPVAAFFCWLAKSSSRRSNLSSDPRSSSMEVVYVARRDLMQLDSVVNVAFSFRGPAASPATTWEQGCTHVSELVVLGTQGGQKREVVVRGAVLTLSARGYSSASSWMIRTVASSAGEIHPVHPHAARTRVSLTSR